MIKTTSIFGFNFICDLSQEELSNRVIDDVMQSHIGIENLITPNANGINIYRKHPEVNEFAKSSYYVLPDGQPIVWLSRFTPAAIKRRLTGSDFFATIFPKIKAPQFKCLFLVSNEFLRSKFMKEKPEASYLIPEFFTMEEPDKIERIAEQMFSEIVKKEIRFVFTGISDPKQVALSMEVTKKLKSADYSKPCLFLFLGASFEFYFGLKKRAPVFYQKVGLEWFYRLIMEPRRMFKRYVIGNFVFLWRALLWILFKKE